MFLDSFEVFDLALGKPALYCLPSNASLREAMELSKELNLSEISVWDEQLGDCIGVLNTLDILCFLAEENRANREAPFSHPISELFHKAWIQHVNLHDRLTKALEMVAQGVQFLLVPLPTCMRRNDSSPKSSIEIRQPRETRSWPRKELCWISQEAVMRFMMSCIAAFCPVPLFSINELGIINRDFAYVEQQDPAINALDLIRQASQNLSAVAVVQVTTTSASTAAAGAPRTCDEIIAGTGEASEKTQIRIVGDISSSTLRSCDEILAVAALTMLSAAEFLSYVHGGGASKRNNSGILRRMISARRLGQTISGSSFDEQDPVLRLGPSLDTGESSTSGASVEESSDSEHDHSWSSSSGPSSRKSQGLTCRPWSSLAAVMAQALSHQSSYIWVTEADNTIVGIVNFVDIIRVLIRKVDHAGSSGSTQKLFSSTPKLAVVSR